MPHPPLNDSLTKVTRVTEPLKLKVNALLTGLRFHGLAVTVGEVAPPSDTQAMLLWPSRLI